MHPENALNLGDVFVTVDGQEIGAVQNVQVEVVPSAPEIPKNYWQENGFTDDIARICNDLEGEREQFMLNARTRQTIETIRNMHTVEDFDRYSVVELDDFVDTLRNQLPNVERQVVSFVNQLTSARAVQNDNIDYI